MSPEQFLTQPYFNPTPPQPPPPEFKMGLGTPDIVDTLWQILGTAALLETIFELVYVYFYGNTFTRFEKFFFVYTAFGELLGELLALRSMLRMFSPAGSGDGNAEGGEAGGAERQERFRRWDIVKAVLRDPLHNYAYSVDFSRKDDERSRSPGSLKRVHDEHPTLGPYFRLARSGVVLSGLCSILVWAIFLPMWGMFDGDDYDFRLWICLSFWIWFSAVQLLSIKCEDDNSKHILFLVTAYALNKAASLYLLFSRGDRLADDIIGTVLCYLQIAEMSSVAIIVYRALFTDVYNDSENTSNGLAG